MREFVHNLMSNERQLRQTRSLIFPPKSGPPFQSWGDFERRLVDSFWKEKPEGAHVLSNPICAFLAADDLMRAANVSRWGTTAYFHGTSWGFLAPRHACIHISRVPPKTFYIGFFYPRSASLGLSSYTHTYIHAYTHIHTHIHTYVHT